VTLASTKTGFNYVLFTMLATGKGTPLQDGGIAVLADVLAESGDAADALAHNIRMIFVPGTEPFNTAAAGLADGDELTVIGIPRINLNAVSAFLKAAGNAAVSRKLPYEMIVVALKGVPR
jgi:hypothetical protein